MNPDDLPLLACPDCRQGAISVTKSEMAHGRIQDGELKCDGCGATFKVKDGIALMLPSALQSEQDQAQTRKRKEMKARDEQAEDYDRMAFLNAFGKVEVPVTVRFLDPRSGDQLLEVGCGTGRMTTTFAKRVKKAIGVDFSLASLLRCREKLDRAGRHDVSLLQADACALPFLSHAFDKVVSCQVLEHVPTEDARKQMVKELARVANPEANVVISAYKNSIPARVFAKKEGEHEGGIYFYRFDWPELKRLLEEALRVERKTGALVYHYLTRCKPA